MDKLSHYPLSPNHKHTHTHTLMMHKNNSQELARGFLSVDIYKVFILNAIWPPHLCDLYSPLNSNAWLQLMPYLHNGSSLRKIPGPTFPLVYTVSSPVPPESIRRDTPPDRWFRMTPPPRCRPKV